MNNHPNQQKVMTSHVNIDDDTNTNVTAAMAIHKWCMHGIWTGTKNVEGEGGKEETENTKHKSQNKLNTYP